MRRLAPLLTLLAANHAQAAPLDLDPADPPVVVQQADDTLPMLAFPDGTRLASLPAVVVVVEPDAAPPPGARPLGPTGRSWRIPTSTVQDAVDLAADLQDLDGVQSAFPDVVQPLHGHFDDPQYGGQWYHELLGMEALWARSRGDVDVRVAVIDSGIDLDHPDLEGAWIAPFDALDDDDDPRPPAGDDHGTAVSGIITARADNGQGIVGVCPECTLIPIRLLGDGGGALSQSIAAFEHAIAQDAAVINNSWGYVRPTPVPVTLAQVITRAATETRDGKGSVVIFAAGNDNRTINDDELQALPEVLCVSATDRYGQPTNYTNEGATVDVSAPSATVTLAAGGGTTVTFGGTSAAAPVAAGLAAWLISVDPDLTAEEVRDLLVDTAVPSPQVDYDEDGHHPIYGYGEVSAQALLEHYFPADQPPVEDDAQARACGCAAAGGGSDLAGLIPVALLALVRRRRWSDLHHGPRPSRIAGRSG